MQLKKLNNITLKFENNTYFKIIFFYKCDIYNKTKRVYHVINSLIFL